MIGQENNIRAKNQATGSEVIFPNIIDGLDSNEWTFVGLSLGWTGVSNYYVLWAYISQIGNSSFNSYFPIVFIINLNKVKLVFINS